MLEPLDFVKYQAAGNDFVLIDDRTGSFPHGDVALVARLCNRRFGIGADGLILIRESAEADFEMIYFNADGRVGSLCGNGSRAAAHFARSLGLADSRGRLLASDGQHEFNFENDSQVSVEMREQAAVETIDAGNCFVNTGSPHHIVWVDGNLDALHLAALAPPIRYAERYAPGGTNVNFVRPVGPSHLEIRTWERGVEGETLSCGTGVTAAAVAWKALRQPDVTTIRFAARGGLLEVDFTADDERVWLRGPVQAVFRGRWGA